jgi:hypothetical protein
MHVVKKACIVPGEFGSTRLRLQPILAFDHMQAAFVKEEESESKVGADKQSTAAGTMIHT